jgi:hypothetical protein
MKFRDSKTKKFFAAMVNICDEFNFYEVQSSVYTRYETVFCNGYIDDEVLIFALINYKMIVPELVISGVSKRSKLIQDVWQRCTSG